MSQAKTANTDRRDVRQEVTDSIIRRLEQGVMPWRRGWRDAQESDLGLLLPRNGISNALYRGGNKLSLLTVMHAEGYRDPRFFTFKQLQSLDAGPQKGSRGYPVEYWDKMPFWKRRDCVVMLGSTPVKVHDVQRVDGRAIATVGDDRRDVHAAYLNVRAPDGAMLSWQQAERTLDVLYSRYSVVFNVQQCRGLEKYLEQHPLDIPKRSEMELDEKLKDIVSGMEKTGLRVKFEPQNKAFYRPSADMVMMPLREQFDDVREFRSTLLHELAHATGHESRLNRDGITKSDGFGSPRYAREELIAELASAFMSAETGIERVDDQHAAYIQSWLTALKGKDGKHLLFEAAREADKATDYLLDRARELAQEVELDGAAPDPARDFAKTAAVAREVATSALELSLER